MYECNMYPLNVSQNTKFTLMMTTRAPEAWTLSQFPALPMLSACWGNHPRGPIKATHRQPLATPTSRRSSRSCHAASATPVQTKRRERTTSPCHDEAYLYIYLEHMQYRFIFSCGVGFFCMKLFKLFLFFPNGFCSSQCKIFVNYQHTAKACSPVTAFCV